MNKLEKELLEKVNTIWIIVVNARENILFANYLDNPESEEEMRYINSSGFFRLAKASLFAVGILELSKIIFNDSESKANDKYSINAILRNLKKDGHYRILKMPIDSINQFESKILASNGLIERLKEIRDNGIAHTKSLNFDYKGIYTNELEQLITIIHSFIKDVKHYIFGQMAQVDETVIYEQGKFDIIKLLVKYDKQEIQEKFSAFLKK